MATTVLMREVALLPTEGRSGESTALAPMDEEAFRGFYDRTARPLWAYLARITGDRQLADDLLQEAYFRFFKSSTAYESESHRRNSLFRIATNLARDSARRRAGSRDIPMPEDLESMDPSQEIIAARTECRTDLARALARLKPRQREMLWLAYALGSSHDEIASTVGITTGSVKSLLLRARRKLAELLRATHAQTDGRSNGPR